ncbi:MAG: glycosyltransferase family 2 protein [Bdellovibrionota bacterium]
MKQQFKNKLSLVIITLNEEKNIERCIRSAPMALDIVVLDSGSRDRTREIAQSLGARVFNEPWPGFYKQKTRAVELAEHNWVLSLDADEALSPAAQIALTELLDQDLEACDGFEFSRMTYHLGRWLRHGGNYPDRQVRFFHRHRAHWLNTNVHERIIAKNVKRISGDILHWPFANGLFDQIATVNKYSALRAQDFADKGKRFSSFKLVGKTLSKFIETYFLKRGFLDGVPGLISALVSSFATFLRWAKLYEQQNSKADSK